MPLLKDVIVAYDIPNDKRRTKLFKKLQGYGISIQYSAFQCRLRPKDLVALESEIRRIVVAKEDKVLIITLCHDCYENITRIGMQQTIVEHDVIVV